MVFAIYSVVRQIILTPSRFPATYSSKFTASLASTPTQLSKMQQESPTMETLEKNADAADKMITEINAEVTNIQQKMAVTAKNLEQERERVRAEIKHYQQYLTLLQIRNGKLYIPPPRASSVPAVGGSGDTVTAAKPVSTPAAPEKKQDSTNQAAVGDSNGKPTEKSEETKTNKSAAKKETGGGAPKQKGQAAPAGEEVVDVGRLDFRIGKIVDVGRHPDADTLYVEKVDVGEANPRTVVSGLVKHVPIEEMQNRMVVLLCNLKPAKMRGVTSEAMVMCASSPEKVEILIPPNGAVPGDLIEFNGIQRNADPVLNPKKKIFETVAPDLKTNESKVATYKGIPFEVKGKGVVSSPTLVNVNIK